MTPDLVQRLWRAVAVGVTAVLVVLLLAPPSRLPVGSLTDVDGWVHLVAYLLVGLSWHRAGLRPAWVLALGLALAGGTEAAQDVMGWGRQADPSDLAANVVGLLLGLGGSLVARPSPRS